MKKTAKISTAKCLVVVWFAFLILLVNTPMDFVHLFAGHKDTVHHEQKGLCFENKHHHCACLSLSLTCFINDYQLPYVCFTMPEFMLVHESVGVCHIQRCIIASSLRGPPSA